MVGVSDILRPPLYEAQVVRARSGSFVISDEVAVAVRATEQRSGVEAEGEEVEEGERGEDATDEADDLIIFILLIKFPS